MNETKSVKEFFCTKTGGVVLTAIVYAITLLLMSFIGWLSNYLPEDGTFMNAVGIIGIILIVVWTVLGWKSLSMIQPQIFLIMPIVGWIAYFVIKGFLSMLLGIFIAPYQIAKTIHKKLINSQ